jgi:2,4-dienoyl-CoA reductase-like NADH-dependent reductase (Old Yellow Enzyme family)
MTTAYPVIWSPLITRSAGAGLIISEGVYPATGKGYVRTPGIETDEQVSAWKKSPTRCMLKAAEFSCN